MDEDEKRFIWIKDEEGKEYVCQKTDLNDPNIISLADLTACLENSSGSEMFEGSAPLALLNI